MAEQSALPEAVKHRQQLLRFPQSEKRDEHGRAAVELRADGVGQAQLLAGTGEALRRGAVAAGGLDDEHVQLVLGKARALHDRLVVELDVAGVENRAPLGADERADGAEDVAGIEELDGHVRAFIRAQPLAGHVEARVQRHGPPAFHGQLDFAVGEKRVGGDAFLALFLHHVDRVVEHHVAELARGFRHENGRTGVAAHEHGDGADVVLMRVREEDDIRRAVGDQAVVGQREVAVEARVQAGVENEALAGDLEAVAVGADFDLPREIGKGETGHGLGAEDGDEVGGRQRISRGPRELRPPRFAALGGRRSSRGGRVKKSAGPPRGRGLRP